MNLRSCWGWANTVLCLLSTAVSLAPVVSAPADESSLVFEDANGRLRYSPYANEGESNAVNTIPDFSGVGYGGGGVPLPMVPVLLTVSPGAGDDTATIQAALDSVASMSPDGNGFRGAVLLTAGRYQVGSTLYISGSGVVLRGEGQDELGTVLEATGSYDYPVIQLGAGSGSYSAQSGTARSIATPYVPVGASSFDVSDAFGYAVGDRIVIERLSNQAWIDTLGMGPYGWTSSIYQIKCERTISGVSGNTIHISDPITDVIQDAFGGGQIFRSDAISRVRKSGVESLRIESTFASVDDENHPWDAIRLRYVEDSWVRGVSAKYFAFSCVNVGDYTRYITVQDCAFLEPKSRVTGGLRYAFYLELQASHVLFQRCYAEQSRHSFVTSSRVTGPHVFADCFATATTNDSGPHHRWASGVLYDNVFDSHAINVQNRASLGTGHGWAGVTQVFWNCQANSMICDAPIGGMNFSIGCEAQQTEGTEVPGEPFGWWEHLGNPVLPRSLYYRQLEERLGPTAVQNLGLPEQQVGRIWDELEQWAGQGTFQSSPVDPATPSHPAFNVGADAVMTVTPLTTVLAYEWFEDLGSSYVPVGTDSPTLTISNLQPVDEGRAFFCRVLTASGPWWTRRAVISNVSLEAIEDFEALPLGSPDGEPATGVLGGVWDTHTEGTGTVLVESIDAGNVARFSGLSTGAARGLLITQTAQGIDDGSAGTLQFRMKVRNAGADVNAYFGLHDVDPSTSDPLNTSSCHKERVNAGIGLQAVGGSPSEVHLTRTDGTVLATLSRDAWYNVWIDCDNASDTFDLFLSTDSGMQGEPPSTAELLSSLSFDVPTTATLYGAMFLSDDTSGSTERIYIDDIYWHVRGSEPDIDPPLAPTGLVATSGLENIDIDWADNVEPDLHSYTVYRSTTSGTNYSPVAAAVQSSGYTDTSVTLGTSYYYVVTASDVNGNESAHSLEVMGEPGNSVDSVAAAEQANAGTVTNSYTDTHTSDDGYESIQERLSKGKPAKRTSELDHRWIINVTAGDQITLFVEAHGTAGTDNFVFAYSTDNSSYTNVLAVTKKSDDDSPQTASLPSSLSGTVYIRVRDTDRSPNDQSSESLIVDHLFIRTESGSVEPPPPPAATLHVASNQVSAPGAGKGRKKGRSVIVIEDDNGDPVPDAVVSGTFSGTFNEAATGLTDSTGRVVLETTATTKGSVTILFCVDDVAHSTLIYDPSLNSTTCASN